MEQDSDLLILSDSSFCQTDQPTKANQELSQIGELSPSECYQSNYVDNLLETSYVEFQQKAMKSVTVSNPYENSSSSFYKRSDNLIFSDIGPNSKKTKMKHKKLQCQIGSNTSAAFQSQPIVRSNQQKLQILKMIKLLKLLFRQLRWQRNRAQIEVGEQRQKFKTYMEEVQKEWNQTIKECQQKEEIQKMRFIQLEADFRDVLQENHSLRKTLEFQSVQSSKRLRFVEEDNWRSFTEIVDEVSTSKAKIEEMTHKISFLENQTNQYNDEVSHLSDAIDSRQVQIKKLEYINRKLQDQNIQLNNKLQTIISKYQECQSKLNQECLAFEEKKSSIGQMIKMNQIYLKELSECKQYIKMLQAQKETFKVESEDFIVQQLNKYQEFFTEEYNKMKKQFNQQLFEKNNLINELKFKEKLFMSVLAEKHNIKQQQCNSSTIIRNEKQHHIDFGNCRSQIVISRREQKCASITISKSKQTKDKETNSRDLSSKEKENHDKKCYQSNKGHENSSSSSFFQEDRQKVQKLGEKIVNHVDLSFSSSQGFRNIRGVPNLLMKLNKIDSKYKNFDSTL